MKKKICLLLAVLLFTNISSVKAAMHADGGGGTASGNISNKDTCVFGSYSGLSLGQLHAIRMSVVDANGNRIAGTNSIDLTNKNTGGVSNLTKYQMRVADDLPEGVWVHRLDGNHTRNEIINGAQTAAINRTYGVYQIYYWNKLPYFNSSGVGNGGTILRRYFETNFGSSDVQDMETIFRLMNYSGYTDRTIYENHFLLVEPIFYLYTTHPISQNDNGNCVATQTFYYGTGTEIFKMIVRDNTFYQFGSLYGTFQDIGTRVHDTMTVAGLREADSIMNNRTAIKNYALSSNPAYGLASMHVWMSTVLCTGPDCPSDDSEDDSCYNACTNEYIPYSRYPNLTPEQVQQQYCSDTCRRNCTDDMIVQTVTGCDPNTGAYQTIADTTNWACIFDQYNQTDNTNYDYEFYHPNGDVQFSDTTDMTSSIINRYCTVACRESVSYNFPNDFNVLAGGRFTIGNYSEGATTLGPITMRGTTTCKTGYNKNTRNNTIDVEKFRRDYAEANEAVADAWNEVIKVKVKIEALKNAENNRSAGPTGTGQHNCLSQNALTYCYTFSGYSNGTYYGDVGDRRCHDLEGRDVTTVCEDHASRGEVLNGECGVNTWGECTYEHDGQQYYDIYTYTGSSSGTLIQTTSTPRNLNFTWTETFHEHVDRGRDYRYVYDKNNYDNALREVMDVYNRRVAYRDNLLNQIKACSNFQRTFSEFVPEITFIYSDDYYKDDHLLSKLTTIESSTIYNIDDIVNDINPTYNASDNHTWSTIGYDGSSSAWAIDYSGVYGDKSVISSWKCGVGADGKGCDNINVEYPTNTNASQTTVKSINYTLPNNLYRYVTKYGIAYSSIEEIIESNIFPGETSTELLESEKVKILEGSSLPLRFSEGDCYDIYRIEYYYLNGESNLFGTSQKFLQYGKITTNTSTTFNGVTVSEDFGYKCNYNIIQNFYMDTTSTTVNNSNTQEYQNEYTEGSTSYTYNEWSSIEFEDFTNYRICCTGPNCGDGYKDLNIIYRPISLGDPFPGESGNTRVPGANWQGIVNGTNTTFVDAYITNNRNTTTDDVYKLKPIYEFVLTPTNMRRIRQYNNKQKDDYNDSYTLSCYKNGDYCQSDFLHKGIGAGYFSFTKENPNGGTCYDADITNWDTCRYTEVGGS